VVPGTSFKLSWFPNFMECAESHNFAEESAQKQQHRGDSHGSSGFVMCFAILGVNILYLLNLQER
jgi:hypothetical protein